jgi:P27 family predicted phage terminase small subunit
MPTALKVLRGNPGKRPLPATEAHPGEATIGPPAWLDEDAQTEWNRVAPVLARNGVLTEMDVDALTAYCEAFCRWKAASQKIREFGMVIRDGKGRPIKSPYVPIAHKAMETMKALMTEFGMTPSSRARVPVVKRDTQTDAKRKRFFGIGA